MALNWVATERTLMLSLSLTHTYKYIHPFVLWPTFHFLGLQTCFVQVHTYLPILWEWVVRTGKPNIDQRIVENVLVWWSGKWRRMWSGLDFRTGLVPVFMHTRKHRHANHTRTHGDVKQARMQAVTPHDLVSFIHPFITYSPSSVVHSCSFRHSELTCNQSQSTLSLFTMYGTHCIHSQLTFLRNLISTYSQGKNEKLKTGNPIKSHTFSLRTT